MKTRKDRNDVYFGLLRAHAPRCYEVRKEDCDYLHKLTDREKEWLARFNEMFVQGRAYKDQRYPRFRKKTRRQLWVEQAACRKDITAKMPRKYDAVKGRPERDFLGEMAQNGLETDLDSFENVIATCPRCNDYDIEFFESRQYHGVYFGMCKDCAKIGREEIDQLMPKRKPVPKAGPVMAKKPSPRRKRSRKRA